MESLYLLVPLSVLLVFAIGILFWWSLRHGQFDDLEGPAYRLLLDDKDELPVDSSRQSGENTPSPKIGASQDDRGNQ
ncbi:cbb3-type cytochrome oxidase assembly protein CcoS [Azoarcus sp. TTM-91]|uniref:cbb3-type cytochrome oxidase assembly protein CcoS n=1 Tax=Azoarcus sp. TTM-91 TaxID=2691581 RepID=UPI00145DFCD5|nr:cbb3-type cytochrome oxidase assembly protein CcoS [Azoarcus sp. TTM-91]NMG34564.1 cbb3-type cytochrome oxidase assembly protein CcoS [Azoarcus sp. TTM-91]